MRNQGLKVAMRPRGNLDIASPAVFYKMHEGSGTTIADSFGNGPNFTITTGTPLATNAGWYTPAASNSTIWANCTVAADDEAYLQSLLDMRTTGQEILIGFDIDLGIDIADIQTVFSAGRDSATGGFFLIGMTAGEALQIIYRSEGASAATSIALGQDLTGLARKSVLVSIRPKGNLFDWTAYVDGSSVGTNTNADWRLNSGTGAPILSSGYGFFIGARPHGTNPALAAQYLNAGAGEETKINHLFMARLPSVTAGLAASVALDLYKYPGETPRSLEGL